MVLRQHCYLGGVLLSTGCATQVSAEVLLRMKQAMVDSNSSASHSFLLDDDSSLPFQAAELLANMDDKVGRREWIRGSSVV